MYMETNQQDFAQKILQFILKNDNYLLSAHINADGDAIASMIAVHLLLKKLGKHSMMVLHDQKKDGRLDYLKDFDKIVHFANDGISNYTMDGNPVCNAIVLDVPGYDRLGDVQKILPAKNHVIKIDHHPSEDQMGDLEWIDEHSSSTAAMVYEIVERSEIPVDRFLAEAIFTGIVYDTGRFSFSNTRARDFDIGAKMVEAGVEPSKITNRIFFENSFSSLKTIGKGLASLEEYLNGQVNVIYLNLNDFKGANQGEVEELANYSVAVRNGKVGLFIREVKKNYHKVSLRSKSDVDVNQVAKAFDGGGHARAAGCRISGSKGEVIHLLIREISKQL